MSFSSFSQCGRTPTTTFCQCQESCAGMTFQTHDLMVRTYTITFYFHGILVVSENCSTDMCLWLARISMTHSSSVFEHPLEQLQGCLPAAYFSRADSRFVPSQWETALLWNDVSHWLGASLASALFKVSTGLLSWQWGILPWQPLLELLSWYPLSLSTCTWGGGY